MKVLLTGGSGFIGKHCLAYLLQHGHTVVTTVRSNEKGRECQESYPEFSNNLSYVIVEDMARSGAFDKAVQSEPPFDAVVHTASPFHYHAADRKRDMIDPAIMGTTEILRAIKRCAPSVKRVVITSSFAAVMNFQEAIPVYTSDHWNPITMQQALTDGQLAYVGSKTFAEKAAWDFVENESPGFTLSTINPVMVFGPATYRLESLEHVNTSNALFRDMILGKMRSGITPNSFQWVDVRDVALAHVRAIEVPEAAGQRFLAAAGPYSNHEIAQVIKENFPDLADRLPEHIPVPDGPPSFAIDNTPMKQILGIPFRSLKDCVVDTVKSLLEVKA
ncbi:putative NADPH-dependent methylglyoxal reductase GRP2 [Aspergillus udagawae]|uniref:Putative NADPH-dependent methylglyoxal reductase GRP2 n=1 Tax=Aspergillus udagawae TaxID=91492 RepID=A0A8H3NQW4_9EURO|nr:putative NADPH-dependent methylglyoxal reductase GRP2 [Aspergillus udagawae]